MLIEKLPTPALRSEALHYRGSKITDGTHSEYLSAAFSWGKTVQGCAFWAACDNGDWETARKLQPDLFKPIPGKPHIKIIEENGKHALYAVGKAPIDKFISIHSWLLSVNPDNYDTKVEAVRLWYSYKSWYGYEKKPRDNLQDMEVTE